MFTTTWEVFSNNMGPCVLVGLVMFGIAMGLQTVGQIGGMASQASGEISAVVLFQIFSGVLNFVVQTWMNIGVLYFGIKLARTGQATVGDFFAIGGLVQAYVGYDVWSGTVCTQEREHWATKEDYCRDYTLEVQAIAHDGSDAGFATADIVCEDWFGCAAAPRGASVAALTLALLGLGVRRRRAPGRGPWG